MNIIQIITNTEETQCRQHNIVSSPQQVKLRINHNKNLKQSTKSARDCSKIASSDKFINTSDIPIFMKKHNNKNNSRLMCTTTRCSDIGPALISGISSLISGRKKTTPIISPAKCSMHHNGAVAGYAVATNQGLVRNYNEDRVSIIANIVKPMSRKEEHWPKCSYFGIYDGHGGPGCADYLRDNLHQFVIKEQSFPWNPREALIRGFENAERHFLEIAQKDGKIIDKSGSCAIVVLIIGNICYIANVGDSRAVLSG